MPYRNGLLVLFFVAIIARCHPNSLPIQEIVQKCVSVQSELSEGFLTEGTVLLGDFAERALVGQMMALPAGSNLPIYLPDVPTFWGGVSSPNGKLFAYKTVDVNKDYSSTLIVLNTNGEVTFTLPWDENWGTFYWLNSQQLEFPYVWNDYWQNAPPISDVINVTTGQREKIAPELPDPWMPGGPIIAQLVVWKASYDPTLSLVGYIRGYEPEQSFVLWDMKNNRELWELNKWTTRTVQPAWTQDEKRLAIVVLNEKEDNWDRFELYLIDRNGNAEKWIDLKEHFKDDTVSLTWSPDTRYLIIAPVYKNQTFLVLDTLTGELLDYCIPANVGIWSPDSTQILLHQNDGSNPSIVLDIRNEQAAYITNNKNIIPIGWLAASP